MSENQRIIWYDQLTYQQLGTDDADIQTYHEFCSAFDAVAASCRARGQAFERTYIDVPAMPTVRSLMASVSEPVIGRALPSSTMPPLVKHAPACTP
jgi:hypothetical protein